MAGIADMLVGSVLESSDKTVDIGGAITKGAALAESIGNMQNQRALLEQKKMEIQQAKLTKFVEAVDKGKDFKDPSAKKNYYSKFLPNYRDQLGLQDVFPDDSLQFVTGSDENLGRVRTLVGWVTSGKMKGDEAIQAFNDPIALSEVPVTADAFGGKEGATPDLLGAIKFQREQDDKLKAAALAQQGQNMRQQTEITSTGPKEVAKKTAVEFTKFNSEGGKAGLEAKIGKLDDVIEQLKNEEFKTGTTGAIVAGTLGDRATAIYNKKLKAAADTVKSAINIKSVLDSQFSDAVMKETQRQLGLDENLDNKQNITKLERLRDQLKNEVTNKVSEFQRQGFPVKSSWKGLSSAQKDHFQSLPKAEQERAFKGLIERFDIPIDQLKKELGL